MIIDTSGAGLSYLPGNAWQPIEKAPNDGREILGCFEGQFKWVMFIALALGKDSRAPDGNYAPPTHWMPLPEPPK